MVQREPGGSPGASRVTCVITQVGHADREGRILATPSPGGEAPESPAAAPPACTGRPGLEGKPRTGRPGLEGKPRSWAGSAHGQEGQKDPPGILLCFSNLLRGMVIS